MSDAGQKIHRAIYTGSFDPPTLGHLDVIRRGRLLFDDLIVAVGRNISKKEMFPLEQRRTMLHELVSQILDDEPEGGSVRVAQYSGLTVDFARQVGARVILRGIRNVTDLAYECQLAMTNRQVADLETVFIMTSQAYAYTSSNLIRQIAALGGDIDRLSAIVPTLVIKALKQMKQTRGLQHLVDDQVE